MAFRNDYEVANIGAITTDCCINNLENLYEERKIMQFLVKLRLQYEVVRANQLNR